MARPSSTCSSACAPSARLPSSFAWSASAVPSGASSSRGARRGGCAHGRAEAPYEDALDAFLSLAGSRETQERTFRAGRGGSPGRCRHRDPAFLRAARPSPEAPAPALGPARVHPGRHPPRGSREGRPAPRLHPGRDTGDRPRDAREAGGDPHALRSQVEAKLREVDDKIRGLELMRAELRAVIAAECDSLIDCECGDCPIDGHARPPPRAPAAGDPMSRRIGTGLLVRGRLQRLLHRAPPRGPARRADGLGALGAGWPWMVGVAAAGTAAFMLLGASSDVGALAAPVHPRERARPLAGARLLVVALLLLATVVVRDRRRHREGRGGRALGAGRGRSAPEAGEAGADGAEVVAAENGHEERDALRRSKRNRRRS